MLGVLINKFYIISLDKKFGNPNLVNCIPKMHAQK